LATINPNDSKLLLTGDNGSVSLLPSGIGTPAYIASGAQNGFMFTGGSATVVNLASISSTAITSIGDITGYGTPSDIKLKENIERIPNGLEMIESLSGYRFNYIGKTDKMIGVIAQELEAVAPELVYETESLETGETSKAVRYSQLTAILIEAVKELSAEVKKLKKKLGE
jgi:hypothetical protein